MFDWKATSRMPGVMQMANEAVQAVSKIADSGSNSLTVTTFNNHVNFYSDVNSDRCLALIQSIREIDTQLRNERATRMLPDDFPMTPIWLHINSDGGYLFDAFAVADQMRSIKSPIYAIAEGVCASAATLIHLAATKRYALPNAMFLFHQLSGGRWGTHEQFEDELFVQNTLMDKIVKLYVDRTRVHEAVIREMLTRDSWFDVQKALEYGVIEGVL
jgi:ATP-dependent protease ClpP protease subunit